MEHTIPTGTPPAAPVSTGPVVAPRPGSDPEDHLVTGWEPHRPLGDGLVRRFVHAYASSFTGPVHHMGGRVVQRDDHVAWDLGRPGGLFTGAMLLRPPPPDAWPSVMAAVERDLDAEAAREATLFSPWPTPDLSGRGWRLVGHPPLLLRARGEPAPPPPAWLELRRVADADTLADWERVAVLGYPITGVEAAPGALVDDRLLADPAFHAWVAYADGSPVAIGTSYVVHGMNVFMLGVTLPSHRGRGAWDALARRRLAAFPGLPAAAIVSDLSRSPAQRLGFLPLQRWTVWSRPHAARGAP